MYETVTHFLMNRRKESKKSYSDILFSSHNKTTIPIIKDITNLYKFLLQSLPLQIKDKSNLCDTPDVM